MERHITLATALTKKTMLYRLVNLEPSPTVHPLIRLGKHHVASVVSATWLSKVGNKKLSQVILNMVSAEIPKLMRNTVLSSRCSVPLAKPLWNTGIQRRSAPALIRPLVLV